MITMQLLAVCVLLCGSLTRGLPVGLVEDENPVSAPSNVLEGRWPNPSILEEDLNTQDKPAAQKQELLDNVYHISKESNVNLQELPGVSKESSNAQNDDNTTPVLLQERPKAITEEEENPTFQDKDQVVLAVAETLTEAKEIKVTVNSEAVKSLALNSNKDEVKLPTREKVEVPIESEEEEVTAPMLDEEKAIEEEELVSEEEGEQEEDEEDNTPAIEVSSLLKGDEGGKSEDDSLIQEWATVYSPHDQGKVEDVQKDSKEEEGNDSNPLQQQNVTVDRVEWSDEDLMSILQARREEKPPKDDHYTIFVIEEDDDYEDAPSKSQEENDNTWFIFEEDQDDEAASESQEDGNRMPWLNLDEDYPMPGLQRNNDTMPSDGEDGVQSRLDVLPSLEEGYEAPLDNSDESLDYDFSDPQNRSGPKEERLSSHFYAYVIATVVIAIALYAVYHYNRKIIAFCMEKRSGAGWGARDANYQFLDNKI
ncbi:trans-Golgi network integral membrane protein TGN38-like [Ambystoma mexicanum]|uniref:trans-Golgi network integral membrane protein TGN38-like n=1 Tax=Ambystoma mexicanum TaxID=8296 RepID=UPI0037E8349E